MPTYTVNFCLLGTVYLLLHAIMRGKQIFQNIITVLWEANIYYYARRTATTKVEGKAGKEDVLEAMVCEVCSSP